MFSLCRVLGSLALMICLAAGLLDDCQPCEDPSQLFCETSVSAPTSRT